MAPNVAGTTREKAWNTPVKYFSCEGKPNTKDFYGEEFNPVFS